jgi:threonine synthase
VHIESFVCTLCGRRFPKDSAFFTCPSCGKRGILEIKYDYERIRQVLTKESLQSNPDRTIRRYLELLSIPSLPKDILAVGGTPLYRSVVSKQHFGLKDLWIKDDGLNPTASLKDRASVIACAHALSLGMDTVACSSTGNAASSLAGSAAKMGLKSVIFVPKRAPQAKLAQLLAFGATVYSVDGDYKAAFQLSKEAIATFGWYNRNAAINPHLVEGKKTVAYEICEQLNYELPDWVVVSVGDGCTIAGVYKGFYDFYRLGFIPKIPKLLGVQAQGCKPFVDAWEEDRDLIETDEDTIADSIAVGIPRNPLKAIRAVKESSGAWIAVSDQAILNAIHDLAKREGVFSEPAAAAAYAGLAEAVRQGIIQKDESALVISTGSGLKDILHVREAVGDPIAIPPDMKRLEEALKKEGRP